MIILFTLFILFILLLIVQVRSLCTLLVEIFYPRNKKFENKLSSVIYPSVLVQIPVYNEGWGVEKAALAALHQEYPAEKLCLQIIDDSSQRYPDLVEHIQIQANLANVNFQYLHRENRNGYKSGALNYGMRHCDHEFIVVLDADFILAPDFLKTCIPRINADNIAGIQTRWFYRNKFQSPTVAIQSTIFETIFALEQNVRHKLGIPALFTGTSGIWRRKVIDELGGWREQPFTAEDIDLTLRSYNAGYTFLYLDQALSSCEATPDFIAFKRQQQRWARGVMQAGVHNVRNIFVANQPPISKILEISTAIYNLSPLILLLFALLSSVYVCADMPASLLWKTMQIGLFFFISFSPLTLGIAYSVNKYNKNLKLSDSMKTLLGSCLSIGLAWSIMFGVWEVFSKSKKEFVVTPKGDNTAIKKKEKWISQRNIQILLECFTFLYFGGLVLFAFPKYMESTSLFVILSLSGGVSFITSLKTLNFNRR